MKEYKKKKIIEEEKVDIVFKNKEVIKKDGTRRCRKDIEKTLS